MFKYSLHFILLFLYSSLIFIFEKVLYFALTNLFLSFFFVIHLTAIVLVVVVVFVLVETFLNLKLFCF